MQTALNRVNNYSTARPTGKSPVKMQGNVAYINNNQVRQKKIAAEARTAPNTAARPAVKTSVRPAVKTAARPAVKTAVKPAARSRSGVASTIAILIVAFAALAVLVSRYAILCSIGVQNNKLEKSIQKVETQIEEIKLDMELRDDLQYVQDTAQYDMGMTYPGPEQKMHIDMSG